MTKNEILIQRSITALFFGLAVIGLLSAGKTGAIILGLTIALTGSYEYGSMVFKQNKAAVLMCVALVLATLLLIFLTLPLETPYYIINVISIICMIMGIISLYIPFINHTKSGLLIAPLYIGLPFGLFISFLVHSQTYSYSFWLFVIILIWMSDSFAYLVGSRIGRRKLMPAVSPGKSWEGFLGAGIISLPLAYWIGSTWMNNPENMYNLSTGSAGGSGMFWVLVAAGVWLVGTWGDLFESSVKRSVGVKDSGNILPGHGGMLDRFDSFIYILPFILFLLQIFSK
jgi:phosphatidate cytidylyltransferase